MSQAVIKVLWRKYPLYKMHNQKHLSCKLLFMEGLLSLSGALLKHIPGIRNHPSRTFFFKKTKKAGEAGNVNKKDFIIQWSSTIHHYTMKCKTDDKYLQIFDKCIKIQTPKLSVVQNEAVRQCQTCNHPYDLNSAHLCAFTGLKEAVLCIWFCIS